MDLTDAEFAMLEWAEKLTLHPAMMTQDDIQKLRDVGWTDRDILDICHVCAYFNFRVRIVDGLGLQIDDRMRPQREAGAVHAAQLASDRGVPMPSDPWAVR